jgi:hypothetical protein
MLQIGKLFPRATMKAWRLETKRIEDLYKSSEFLTKEAQK